MMTEPIDFGGFEPVKVAGTRSALLVSMPWRVADCPNLALGLLKPMIESAGLSCSILEASLVTSVATPRELYHAIGGDPAGEIAFSPFAYDGRDEEQARDELRRAFPTVRDQGSYDAGSAVDIARGILEQLGSEINWSRYDIVGFSLTFQQTLASVALARRIKVLNPDIRIVIGGACCEGPMGKALLEEFPCFDFAVSGRAEGIITDVMGAMLGQTDPAAVPGLSYRRNDGSVDANESVAARFPMDQLPIPDFDDYFNTRRSLGLGSQGVRLLLETSVGCWWGQKHLCSFCGLNATSLAYHQKSGDRVLTEISQLSKRYKVDVFELVDNILPMSFFNDLLPTLAEQDHTYSFFGEVKSNLNKQQLQLLADAGFRFLQPGIESFDDHILEVMDKGCTGIGQVQFIKWCDELGIDTAYSMLVANPGEHAEDYERMTEWIPSIVHLTPPFGDPVDIQLARFSPYFMRQEAFGIENARPAKIFNQVFPHAPQERLEAMVFMFEYEHQALQEPRLVAARERFRRAIKHWRTVHGPAMLTYRQGDGWLRITDLRESCWSGQRSRPKRFLLRGVQAEIYLFCDRVHGRNKVLQTFTSYGKDKVNAFLDQMVNHRLMIDNGHRILSLAVNANALRLSSPREEEILPVDSKLWEDLLAGVKWEADMPASRRNERPASRQRPLRRTDRKVAVRA